MAFRPGWWCSAARRSGSVWPPIIASATGKNSCGQINALWPPAVEDASLWHWDGVIDAVLTKVTNARSEATNAKIQWIKRLGCGYRNRERFRNAIYFHLGGLDLY